MIDPSGQLVSFDRLSQVWSVSTETVARWVKDYGFTRLKVKQSRFVYADELEAWNAALHLGEESARMAVARVVRECGRYKFKRATA